MKLQTMQAISELERIKSLHVEFSSKEAHTRFLTKSQALPRCRALFFLVVKHFLSTAFTLPLKQIIHSCVLCMFSDLQDQDFLKCAQKRNHMGEDFFPHAWPNLIFSCFCILIIFMLQFNFCSVFIPHSRKESRNIKGKSSKNSQFITEAYLKEKTASMD